MECSVAPAFHITSVHANMLFDEVKCLHLHVSQLARYGYGLTTLGLDKNKAITS